MYKVIIVEDEALIRKGLRYSINWETYKTVVIGEAENGQKGLELIYKVKPDIVITDVNMPIMSGIQMIKNAVETQEFQSIIISGYDEFDYIKGAMAVGSVDYLLKPVSKDDLIKAITKAVKKIEQVHVYNLSKSLGDEMKKLDISLRLYNDDKIVNSMIQYVKEHYKDKIRLSDVSQSLNYSETTLKRRFKTKMNITFNTYLNAYRVKKAIELARNSDYSIQEISSRCGFSDYKYFSVVFKKYTNFSVLDFFKYIKQV